MELEEKKELDSNSNVRSSVILCLIFLKYGL